MNLELNNYIHESFSPNCHKPLKQSHVYMHLFDINEFISKLSFYLHTAS